MSCIIESCIRERENEFCVEHHEAHENIENSFSSWKKAYGTKYSKTKYLSELVNNEELPAGKWVREIAEYLIENK